MKAMVLAAGRGERLRPLTDTLPKPLVEVGGRALIAWHLDRIARAGIRDVVINVSHLAERIVQALGDGTQFGVRIAYSREEQALETAGGIAFARPLLGTAPFLLVNADVFCTYDLARLTARDLNAELAHLVLVPNPPYRPQGDFSLDGARVSNTAPHAYTYAGIALIDPQLLGAVASGDRAPLAPLLRTAADAGRLGGEVFAGRWEDVGTAERLAALDASLARHGA